MTSQPILILQNVPEFNTPEWRYMNDDERLFCTLKYGHSVTGGLSNQASELLAFIKAGGSVGRYYADADYRKDGGAVVKMNAHTRLLIHLGLVVVVRYDDWTYLELPQPEPVVVEQPAAIEAPAQPSIRNPEMWVGKSVVHMANCREFKSPKGDDDTATDDYFVCEWSGRLTRVCDQVGWWGYFANEADAKAAGFDECYYYCDYGMQQMAAQAAGVAA